MANRYIIIFLVFLICICVLIQKKLDEAKFQDKIFDIRDNQKCVADINREIKFKFFTEKYKKQNEILNNILDYSHKYNIDSYLLLLIIEVESEFKPESISNSGDYGLMQINYLTWKKTFNIKNRNFLLNINNNLDIGCKILKRCIIKSNNDIEKAICLYHTGNKNTVDDNYLLKIKNSSFYKLVKK